MTELGVVGVPLRHGEIGEHVEARHLIVSGEETPVAGDPGTFHKDLGGGAYINYKDGVLTVAAEHTIIASLDGGETYQEVEAEKLLQKVHDHEKRIAALEKAVGVGKGAVEWP